MEFDETDYHEGYFPYESTCVPGMIVHNFKEEDEQYVIWAQRIGLPPAVDQREPAPLLFWEDECPKLLQKYQGRPEQQLMALARLVRLIDKRELAWRVLYRFHPEFYQESIPYQDDEKIKKRLIQIARRERKLLKTGRVGKRSQER